tara:strand:- start:105 stop:299 length:195 start_codon:yes stop_codon:yes gene_type:complete
MKDNLKNIEIRSGIEKHDNGSFTMYGSILGETFKQTYYDYSLTEARKLFKKAILVESERYFISQ